MFRREVLKPEEETHLPEQGPAEERKLLGDSLRIADFLIGALQARVAEIEAENKAFRKELGTDALTGIRNERGLRESVERRRAESSNEFVVMYLDADRFKEVNDMLGHDAGDFVIREVAKYLRGIVRPTDIVARLHGDEFVVLFVGATEEDIAKKFEGTKLAFTVSYNGKDIPITLSGGIAASREEESIEDILRRADQAMYISKQNHDGGVTRYSGGE